MAEYFIVDGLNLCMWQQPISLTNLLTLLVELKKRGASFLCIFDASARTRFRGAGLEAHYNQLFKLSNHFSEIPGGIEADEFILIRADKDNLRIISNDRYRAYQGRYPWLEEDPSRLIKGAVVGQAVTIPALNMNVTVNGDVLGLLAELELPIQYGDLIRLVHRESKQALHSHPLNYTHPGTSGEQQVTCHGYNDSDDYWIVKGPPDRRPSELRGQNIPLGSIFRLEHANTKKNLHSHDCCPSPITSQQEVTAYGDNGIGDERDNWKLDETTTGDIWTTANDVKLVHVNTGCVLHSHEGHSHPEYTNGQQEVTCWTERDNNDWWQARIIPR